MTQVVFSDDVPGKPVFPVGPNEICRQRGLASFVPANVDFTTYYTFQQAKAMCLQLGMVLMNLRDTWMASCSTNLGDTMLELFPHVHFWHHNADQNGPRRRGVICTKLNYLGKHIT